MRNPSKNHCNTNFRLIHYDSKQDLVVASDASDTGTSAAILLKFKDGKMKACILDFASSRKKSCQIEKEALAIIFAMGK